MPKNGITMRELAARRGSGYCDIDDIMITYDGRAFLLPDLVVTEGEDGEVRLEYSSGGYLAYINRMDIYRRDDGRRQRAPQGAVYIDAIARGGKMYSRWPECLDRRTMADIGPQSGWIANGSVRFVSGAWTCQRDTVVYDYPAPKSSPVLRAADGYQLYSGGAWCPLKLT